MDPLSTSTVFVLAILHVGALGTACTTRLASGSRMEPLSQLAFFTAMAVVGVAGCFCCQIELGLSVPSGITLVVMVLLAVIDFRPTHETSRRYP